jgi:hypothetical protein
VTPDKDLVFADKSILYRTEENKRSVPLFKWWHAAAAIAAITVGTFLINRPPAKPGTTIIAKVADSNITPENAAPSIAGNDTWEQTVKDNGKADAVINKATKDNTVSAVVNNNAGKERRGNNVQHTNGIPVHRAQNNTPDLPVQDEAYNTAANRPDHLTASDIAGVIAENTTSIQVAAVIPDKPVTGIIRTAAANTTEAVAEAAPENYIQSRKNMLRGLLRKASGIIDKTIEQTTELRNIQQVNIRMGKIEVALH